jgi:hypothetical protein
MFPAVFYINLLADYPPNQTLNVHIISSQSSNAPCSYATAHDLNTGVSASSPDTRRCRIVRGIRYTLGISGSSEVSEPPDTDALLLVHGISDSCVAGTRLQPR